MSICHPYTRLLLVTSLLILLTACSSDAKEIHPSPTLEEKKPNEPVSTHTDKPPAQPTNVPDTPPITWNLKPTVSEGLRTQIGGIVETGGGKVRAEGQSRYGTILIRSMEGEEQVEGDMYYFGNYEVIYRDSNRQERVIAQLNDIDLHHEKPMEQIRRYEFGSYDLFLYEPAHPWFRSNYLGSFDMYAFAVDNQGNAYPLPFTYDKEPRLNSNFFTITGEQSIEVEQGEIVVHAYIPQISKVTLQPDFISRSLVVKHIEDVSKRYEAAYQLAVEYADIIELTVARDWNEAQLLHKDTVGTKKPSELPDVKSYFTKEAWNSKVLQRVIRHGRLKEEGGHYNRPFRWDPIHFRYVDDNTFRFTYTMNILYAIGRALHMDIEMKKHGERWMITKVEHVRVEPDIWNKRKEAKK